MTDAHVRMSLELQAAFGLRREEAIKFTPAYADRGDRVRIKASWAKGGRAREIPIWNEGQRAVLDAARRLAGAGALIAGGRGYAAQRKLYERQVEAASTNKSVKTANYKSRTTNRTTKVKVSNGAAWRLLTLTAGAPSSPPYLRSRRRRNVL